MKKLIGILIISILYSSAALAAFQLSCKGLNTPDVRFVIDNSNIISNERGNSIVFHKKWSISFNVYKGINKSNGSNKSKSEVQIDIIRGKAQVVTTTYHSSSNDDVYVKRYVNCQ